jgi:hypothetical protein
VSACGSFKPELYPGLFVLVDQFVDRIALSELKDLQQRQEDFGKPGERDALYNLHQRTQAAMVGLIDAKKDPEGAKRFTDLIDQRVRAASNAKGKKLTPDEEQELINGVVKDVVYLPNGWFSDPIKKPASLLVRDPDKKIDEQKDAFVEVDGRRVMLSSIPQSAREQIRRDLAAEGQPVTEQAVAYYYLRMQQKQPQTKGERVTTVPPAMQIPR